MENKYIRYCILCFFTIFMIVIIYKPVENLTFKGNDSSHSFMISNILPPKPKTETSIIIKNYTSKHFLNSVLSYGFDYPEITDRQLLNLYNSWWYIKGKKPTINNLSKQQCVMIDVLFFNKTAILGTFSPVSRGVAGLFPCCRELGFCPDQTLEFDNYVVDHIDIKFIYVENNQNTFKIWDALYKHCNKILDEKQFDNDNF